MRKLLFLLFFAGTVSAQEKVDTAKVSILLLPRVELHEVQIVGTWASKNAPIAQTNLTVKDIDAMNSGRDLPAVLGDLPSVVSFSDAGNGVGYTNMRVRGSDITRINVTVNGIPMNDAESHGVFWVNTPDLMSSTKAIQLQKGVGSSTNGSGAFGATLGLHTLGAGEKGGKIHVGLGSFGTTRYTAEASTGLSKNGFWVNSRLSRITSDGYVDRASSDLQSHYISMGWSGGGHYLEFVNFSGSERTYQAWWGIDSLTMYGGNGFAAAPRTNYAGALYGDNWDVIGHYEDQTDNYGQDHLQLHYRMANLWGGTLSAALHKTDGQGYFEEYNQGYSFADFGLPSYVNGVDTVLYGDVVTRKWLDNTFFGTTASWVKENYESNNQWIVGGGAHRYIGDHFGEHIWSNHPNISAIDDEYYRGSAVKDDANIYMKHTVRSLRNVLYYVDAQYRFVQHQSEGGSATGPAYFDRTFHFFNPKIGLTWRPKSDQEWGAFLGVAHREPNRSDLQYAADPNDVSAERMLDLEMNYKRRLDHVAWHINGYYQWYDNQLVLTGAIDNQGYPIRSNVGRSFRRGVELQGDVQFSSRWKAQLHASLSQNINVNWVSDPTSSIVKNTDIAFSPRILGGGKVQYEHRHFQLSLSNAFVGKQYMSNEGLQSHTLPAYHTLNSKINYQWVCDFTQKVNIYLELRNLGNLSYAANGYMWGDVPYYYAQATFHLMSGVSYEF